MTKKQSNLSYLTWKMTNKNLLLTAFAECTGIVSYSFCMSSFNSVILQSAGTSSNDAVHVITTRLVDVDTYVSCTFPVQNFAVFRAESICCSHRPTTAPPAWPTLALRKLSKYEFAMFTAIVQKSREQRNVFVGPLTEPKRTLLWLNIFTLGECTFNLTDVNCRIYGRPQIHHDITTKYLHNMLRCHKWRHHDFIPLCHRSVCQFQLLYMLFLL